MANRIYVTRFYFEFTKFFFSFFASSGRSFFHTITTFPKPFFSCFSNPVVDLSYYYISQLFPRYSDRLPRALAENLLLHELFLANSAPGTSLSGSSCNHLGRHRHLLYLFKYKIHYILYSFFSLFPSSSLLFF